MQTTFKMNRLIRHLIHISFSTAFSLFAQSIFLNQSAFAACAKVQVFGPGETATSVSCSGTNTGEWLPNPRATFTVKKNQELKISCAVAPTKNNSGSTVHAHVFQNNTPICSTDNKTKDGTSDSKTKTISNTKDTAELWSLCGGTTENSKTCTLDIYAKIDNPDHYPDPKYTFTVENPNPPFPPGPPPTVTIEPTQGKKYPLGPEPNLFSVKVIAKKAAASTTSNRVLFDIFWKPITASASCNNKKEGIPAETAGNTIEFPNLTDNSGELICVGKYKLCVKAYEEGSDGITFPSNVTCTNDSFGTEAEYTKWADYELFKLQTAVEPTLNSAKWFNDKDKYSQLKIKINGADDYINTLTPRQKTYKLEYTSNLEDQTPEDFVQANTNCNISGAQTITSSLMTINPLNSGQEFEGDRTLITCLETPNGTPIVQFHRFKLDYTLPIFTSAPSLTTTKWYTLKDNILFNVNDPNAPNYLGSTGFTTSGINNVRAAWYTQSEINGSSLDEKALAIINGTKRSYPQTQPNKKDQPLTYKVGFDIEGENLFLGLLIEDKAESTVTPPIYNYRFNAGDAKANTLIGPLKIDLTNPCIDFETSPTVRKDCTNDANLFKEFALPQKLTVRLVDNGSKPKPNSLKAAGTTPAPEKKPFMFAIVQGSKKIVQECKPIATDQNSCEINLISGTYEYSIAGEDIAGNSTTRTGQITINSNLSPVNFQGNAISSRKINYSWNKPANSELLKAYKLSLDDPISGKQKLLITTDLNRESYSVDIDGCEMINNQTQNCFEPEKSYRMCLVGCADTSCNGIALALPESCVDTRTLKNAIEPKKVIARGKEIEGDNIYFDVDAADAPLFRVEFDNELDANEIANDSHVSLSEIGDFSAERCVDSTANVENGNQIAVTPISISASRCFGKVRPGSSYKITVRPGVRSTSGAVSTKSLTYYFTTRSDTASGRINSPKDVPSARSIVSWPENRRTDVVVVIRPKEDVNRAVVGQVNGSLASSLGNTLSCRSTLCTYNFVEVILYTKSGTTYTEYKENINPPYTIDMTILRSAGRALNANETIFNYGIYKVIPGSSRNTGTLEKLPSSRLVGNSVLAEITTSGIYALAGAPPTSLGNAHPWPVPYKPSAGHTQIQFKNLALDTSIKVFTITGELVWEANNISDGSPTRDWNVKNNDGEPVASGVYVYLLKNSYGEKKGKLMIIK